MRKDAVFWSDHVIYPFKCLTIKLLCVKTRSEITNKYRTPLGEDGQLTMIRLIFFFCTYVRTWPSKFLSRVNQINCCLVARKNRRWHDWFIFVRGLNFYPQLTELIVVSVVARKNRKDQNASFFYFFLSIMFRAYENPLLKLSVTLKSQFVTSIT